MKRSTLFIIFALLLCSGGVWLFLFLQSDHETTRDRSSSDTELSESAVQTATQLELTQLESSKAAESETDLEPLSPPQYAQLNDSDPRSGYIAPDPILVLTGHTPDDLTRRLGVSLVIEQEQAPTEIGIGTASWSPESRFATLSLTFTQHSGQSPPQCDTILQAQQSPVTDYFFAGNLTCSFPEGHLKLEIALDPTTPFITFSPESARVSGRFAEESFALQPDGSLQIGKRSFILTAHRLYPLRNTALSGDIALPSLAQLDQIPLAQRLGMTAQTPNIQQFIAYFPHLSWRGVATLP